MLCAAGAHMPPCSVVAVRPSEKTPPDSVLAVRPGGPPQRGAPPARRHLGWRAPQPREGGDRHAEQQPHRAGRCQEPLVVAAGPAPNTRAWLGPEDPPGRWWLQPEVGSGEAGGQRPPPLQEGPQVWGIYQGRASHPRFGKNVPLQIELYWEFERVGGVWFMLQKSVDVVAWRTDEWPLVVRSLGGMSATLWGREVTPDRYAGEVSVGADGGGTFELLRCPQGSFGAEFSSWGSANPCDSSSAGSLIASVQEPTMHHKGLPLYQKTHPPMQDSVAKAMPKEMNPQLIFTTEEELAKATAEVLKAHPNGIDLAQLKQTIHRSTGVWLSEAFLGYKKLSVLLSSPTIDGACCSQRVGSCNRVFGRGSAPPEAGACEGVPCLADQCHPGKL
ncbi:unnamed protein product [Prorocentrum cordatum]|uniref:HTH OST-type domain-containing protein n=1 Tax=Prorocentrum cordatum TaxID=2364126 RepID=A0ABN9TJV8_9DINO|nr:unnamed protein product [Polarella glacialis]